MNLQKFCNKSFGVFSLLLFMAITAAAQKPQPTPRVIYNQAGADIPIVKGNNLYCAGFIQTAGINNAYEIVGAVNEKDQHIFAQGDLLYISGGANRGVNVGDMFSVVRPRGQVESKWTKKNVGYYVQELGAVEVVRVMNDVSVVRVKNSCDNFLFGDLLEPIPQRVSPVYRNRGELDIFATPTGKARGRILMSRESRELLGREQIVYVDLGADENVRVGDYLTIYRPLGTGNILDKVERESLSARNEDFASEEYEGGKFSIMSPRKAGDKARRSIVKTEEAKSRRPNDLRRIVGEMVILNVKEKTATAIITRVAQEVHTGDFVEVQ